MNDAKMRGWLLEKHAAEKANMTSEIERLRVKADTLQFLLNQRDIDIEGLRRSLAKRATDHPAGVDK